MDRPEDSRLKTLSKIRRNINKRSWRFRNLYLIKDKDGQVVQFAPNWTQEDFLHEMRYRNIILKARQLGFCVSPETRILTANMRWVAAASLQHGDELVGVDERPPGGRGQARRMRTGVVQAAVSVKRKAFRITFDDGRELVCTDRHPWLSKKGGDCAEWRSISGDGNHVVGRLRAGTKVRWITKPWGEPTVEDGWFGGMLDGEGSLSNGNRSGTSVCIAQLRGPVWDRLLRYASERSYNFRTEDDATERLTKYGKEPVPKVVFSRMDEMFRLIGQTRPTRFINRHWWDGRELPGKRSGIGWSKITGIEPLGERELIDLQTSTGTYIAEGFVSHNTTLITLFILDACLWNDNMQAGIIADTDDKAKEIFSDKIKFAYDNLPTGLRRARTTVVDSMHSIKFDNGSEIQVGTSMRGTTKQYLLISELGKIAAEAPQKAEEIKTGAFNTVHAKQFLFVESTARGREGLFYDLCESAVEDQQMKRELTDLSFKFHFYPWFLEDTYCVPDEQLDRVVMSKEDADYFDKVQQRMACDLSPGQRAWYIETRRTQGELMKREYPSTPEEPFEAGNEGRILRHEMARVRNEGRILPRLPVIPTIPVNAFFDLGYRDFMSLWFHQRVGPENRLLRYYENSGYGLEHYLNYARSFGYLLGKFYLPHDADHKHLTGTLVGKSVVDYMLEAGIPASQIVVVPVVENKWNDGVQSLRDFLVTCVFDESTCALGIKRLDNYQKTWNKQVAAWRDEPKHDDNCHAADSLETGARGFTPSPFTGPARRKRRPGRGSYKTV